MVTANTVLGKAAALAMLPALTLGLFASPANAQEAVNTFVGVNNFSTAATTNMVGSVANSGGNVVMSTSASVGGNSGSSAAIAGPTTALAESDADVEVEAEGEEGDDSEVEAEGEAYADGDATATGSATSATGNGGNGGTATNVTTLMTGDATSEVSIDGGENSTEIDVTVEDDCCDRYNEYYDSASMYYDRYHLDEESEYEEEADGEVEEEWSKEESSTEMGGEWESYSKEYVPANTTILVGNVEMSRTANFVMSGADSGSNAVLSDSLSMGGTSGNGMAMTAPVTAAADSEADVEVEVEDEDGVESETEAEGEAAADGDATATNTAGSTTGNGGNGGNTTTDTLVVTGAARSFVGIVDATKHTVIRIQR